jgi:hypothetical protein
LHSPGRENRASGSWLRGWPRPTRVFGLKDNYGLDVKIKDIVIFSEWAENDDHEPVL